MNNTLKRIVLLLIVVVGVIGIVKYSSKLIGHTLDIAISDNESFSDGPYVFDYTDSIEVKWVSEGQAFSEVLEANDAINILHDPAFKVKMKDLKRLTKPESSSFTGVENIAVLSDIHGQYQLFVDLITVNGIVDSNGDWSYGNGHFVIIGDAFDRGEKVNETLWHIIKLKLQAEKAGGKVHYLLGNHDVMVLNADLRYIHEKYEQVEEQVGLSYDQLYGKQSFMGQWLRASPVVIRINNILFNHAGLSPSMAQANMSIDDINKIFATHIIDNTRDNIKADEQLSLLSRSQGPIWYRGYFKDTTLTSASIDSILNRFDAKQVIVGHTSMDEVKVYFDNKVLAVDTSIKRGENGELLFIENETYSQAGLDGIKRALW